MLQIRKWIDQAFLELAWSYVIDLEVLKNPFVDRRDGVASWKSLSITEIGPSIKIVSRAIELRNFGFREIDSLHVACAIEAKSDYFVTTDDAILKKANRVAEMNILDPVGLLKLVEEAL